MTVPTAPVESLLRAVQPTARLTRARHVRRVRRELAAVGEAFGEPLPVWVPADRLAELRLVPAIDPGDGTRVLLLPEPDDLPPADPGVILRVYWRWLVQAEVSRALDGVTTAEAARRLAALGPDAAAEVRVVLAEDHVVSHDADAGEVYRAFAAVALDALAFAPAALGRTFPLLADAGDLIRHQTAEVSLDAVVGRLRPAGAATPADLPATAARPDIDPRPAASVVATEALRRGNSVRAAAELARAGDPTTAAVLRAGLVEGLARCLGWDGATAARWQAALLPVLTPSGLPGWGRGTRCLYDLQKIVTDLAGDPHTLDPAVWALSRGRRPLRLPVPHTRPVTVARHLDAAARHLARAPVTPADRDRLAALIAHARHAAEVAVRADCGPVLHAAVTGAGLTPADLPDRVALGALVAELLDRIDERGFVRFADLRDAVARNGLKLPDLAGAGEFWSGDALLRADRRLGEELAGVYRPAEIYLRVIHRCISAAFGTAAGRWLSLWVLLPFGGGLMAVEFAKYMALEVSHLRSWVRGLFPADEPALPVGVPDPYADLLAQHHEAAVEKAHAGLAFSPASLAVAVALGILFLGLIHSPPFRRRASHLLRLAGSAVWFLLVRLPVAVWDSPGVRSVRRHPAVRAGWRRVGTAVLVAAAVATGLALAGAGWPRLLAWSAAAFALTAAATSTGPGRRFEEDATEAAADGWRVVRHGLLPGLVGGVVALFRAVADRVERGLYAVDEWLRFRDGESRAGRAAKLAAAVIWLPVAYVVRFAFYLLIEPQANPVKHFPVVTVSHKLLLPAVPSLSGLLGLSTGTTAGLVSLVPGVFGFIAWELKESWRLYTANRPVGLPPVPVGHHGETVRGLLVPGFHSGTVPKLFRRLRRADRPGRVAAAEAGLHEVEHALGRFVERHLVAYLVGSAAWAGLTPAAGPVRLGVRTATVGVAVNGFGDETLRVTFAAADGTVTARVTPAGWHGQLTPAQAETLSAAVAGLCRAGTAAGPAGRTEADDWQAWAGFWKGTAVGATGIEPVTNPV